MLKLSEQIATLDKMLSEAVQNRVLHLNIEDKPLNGRSFSSEGKSLLNFGSCSYLGLELDQRLKVAAMDAIERFGTQFSSSRAYLSTPLYAQLEALLSSIFEAPIVVTPTTSLGHISALPVLIHEGDIVILDQQVHSSVQTAAKLVRAHGVPSEVLRHNRMDLLEERIEALRRQYRRVWYLADDVYSMYGDLAPMDDLSRLLDRYEQFFLYVDDAHGMSWTGRHGRGVVLGSRPIRERMVVAVSLAKGFGAGGGALIFPNQEMARQVRTCGGPMIFSGPIQPAVLGAAIASARIHSSPEIERLQQGLQERIRYCNELLLARDLPIISASEAPIHFIGMGLPRVAQKMVRRLMERGYYSNIAMFPAVPMRRAGVRFTLTLHHTKEDIDGFVNNFAELFPGVLAEECSSREEIARSFKLQEDRAMKPEMGYVPALSGLKIQHETSILRIDPTEWNRLLGNRGSFSWEGLNYLEKVFQGHAEPENNWRFHYYLVRNSAGAPILPLFSQMHSGKTTCLPLSRYRAASSGIGRVIPIFWCHVS